MEMQSITSSFALLLFATYTLLAGCRPAMEDCIISLEEPGCAEVTLQNGVFMAVKNDWPHQSVVLQTPQTAARAEFRTASEVNVLRVETGPSEVEIQNNFVTSEVFAVVPPVRNLQLLDVSSEPTLDINLSALVPDLDVSAGEWRYSLSVREVALLAQDASFSTLPTGCIVSIGANLWPLDSATATYVRNCLSVTNDGFSKLVVFRGDDVSLTEEDVRLDFPGAQTVEVR